MNLDKLPNRFKLTGQVLNVFQAPTWERNGKSGGGDYRIQLISVDKLRNGENKVLTSEVSLGPEQSTGEQYKAKVGTVVDLPVIVYANNSDLRIMLAK